MDRWAWEQLTQWLTLRHTLPPGPLFCVLRGPTRDRPCSASGIRVQLHTAAARAGVRAGSRPISCGTRTRSRCLGRASRWSPSNASSDTPISGSPPEPARDRQHRDHQNRPGPRRPHGQSQHPLLPSPRLTTTKRTWLRPGRRVSHSSLVPACPRHRPAGERLLPAGAGEQPQRVSARAAGELRVAPVGVVVAVAVAGIANVQGQLGDPGDVRGH